MSKVLKKLWVIGIALVLAISIATEAFGYTPLPVDPKPPTSIGGGG